MVSYRSGLKYAKKGYSASSLSRAATMVVAARSKSFAKARVKGPVTGSKELNYVDTSLSTTITANGTGVIHLNGIQEGDDNTERNGRKAMMKSVEIDYLFDYAASASNIARAARFALVWDNAPNGTLASYADIFASSTDATAKPLVNNQARFTILRDIPIHCPPVNFTAGVITDASAGNNMRIKFYKKLNQGTSFNGTGATIASVQNGALLAVWGGGITTTLVPSGTSRVRFTDM